MTDFNTIKDILEMSELLDDFTEHLLIVKTVDKDDTKTVNITFEFNEDKELINIYTED